MFSKRILKPVIIFSLLAFSFAVNAQSKFYKWNEFVMGADLSFVNEIEDFGGVYKQNEKPADAFTIFKNLGTNTVRVRLWHDPQWLKAVTGGKLYSDIYDVEKTMRRAKKAGMAVCLDLHYADDWADPNQQPTPDAWKNLSFDVLKDTVYNYTLSVLKYFKSKNLIPEMIQVGNETNFGMLWPTGKIVNDSNWQQYGQLVNSGIKAVRDFSKTSTIKPQIILHVAQLQFAIDWANNMTHKAGVTDFDILGLSHYYKWSTVNNMDSVGIIIGLLHKNLKQKIMVVETAFPWTNENADTYGNLFWSETAIDGYHFTKADMIRYYNDLIKKIKDNGGKGIMVWEPAWITSPMKDRWGKGSSWENNAFFDFDGNLLPGLNFFKRK